MKDWLQEHYIAENPCDECENRYADYEDPDPGACGSGMLLVDEGCFYDKEGTGEPMEAACILHYCPFFKRDTSAEDEAKWYAE